MFEYTPKFNNKSTVEYFNMFERYVMDLITSQQNRTNRYVNVSKEDLLYITRTARTQDMGEIEIIDLILTNGYA